jgi:hypothetical protein
MLGKEKNIISAKAPEINLIQFGDKTRTMLARVYYLFIPKQELLNLVKDLSPDIKDIFSTTFMWSKYEGGITIRGSKENELEIKYFFLIKLWCDYWDSNSEEVRETIKNIFGKPPFNIDVFDMWWRIEKFEVEEVFEEVRDSLTYEQLGLINETGNNLVDQAINFLRKEKK